MREYRGTERVGKWTSLKRPVARVACVPLEWVPAISGVATGEGLPR
jgi:hypothetical protein